MRRSVSLVRCATVLSLLVPSAATPPRGARPAEGAAPRRIDWPVTGGDPGATKYSSLADIDRGNVARLALAWTWRTGEQPYQTGNPTTSARPGNFQATPIVVGDTMYLPTPFNRVVALDATTGRELWRYDPGAYGYGQPSNGTGFVHRGVAMWTSRNGRERRIFLNSRWRLVALDAATGTLIRSFGDTGVVDLTRTLRRAVNPRHYTNTSPPVVWHDLVIVGNGVGDRLVYTRDPPGDVQAFDARTGALVWRFNTIPDSGEFGVETWEDGSWRTAGHTNVWAPFSVDTARGLVYLPVSTPTNDWYGGARKGDNLFAESIVCVDARTGRRVWHFQTVHHGLWDYDLAAAPVLATIRRNDRPVDAVIVPTKMGHLFVFDRVTGAPLFPIEERRVPPSDVPGERPSPTQPFPTRPAPYARQGFTLADVIDFTPALKARATAIVSRYRMGPIFTPPSLDGTIVMPGAIGGSGWGGGAFDPETGIVYLKATNQPALYRVFKTAAPSDTVDASYMVDLAHSAPSLTFDTTTADHQPLQALPITRPPYGTLTAIDLATGDHRWQIPLGDTPFIRRHPLLHGVPLPPRLGVAGAPGGIVTRGGLVFITGGGATLYAIDKTSGAERWHADLGANGYAIPMTFRSAAGRQYVVIATGAGASAELKAFALP